MTVARVLALPVLGIMFLTDATRAQNQSFVCTPTLSVFCRNIHVGCAGRTDIRTSPFIILMQGQVAELKFDNEPEARHGVVWNENSIVIQFNDRKDWIRVASGGRFSHRIYQDNRAAMSYGVCRPRGTSD